MSENIYDLDLLVPDEEYVRLAGKKIMVSNIKTGIALEIFKKQAKFQEMEKSGVVSDTAFDELLDIVIKVAADKAVTRKWLLDNSSMQQLTKFIEIIGENISKKVETKKKVQPVTAKH